MENQPARDKSLNDLAGAVPNASAAAGDSRRYIAGKEELLTELRKQGLPQAYIQRLLDEWDDHLADLQDERSMDMDTSENEPAADHTNLLKLHDRLGDPAQLAAFAAKEYHNRSFLGRHPIFTFIIAPIPLVLLSWIGITTGAVAFGMLLSHFFGSDMGDPWSAPFAFTIVNACWGWLLSTLIPIVDVLILCRVARRNALPWKWAKTAIVLIAMLCACFWMKFIQPTNSHYVPDSVGNGGSIVGLGIITSGAEAMLWLVKFAIALSLGLLLIKRAQRLQKIDERRADVVVFRQAA
ncbi:MAG TPA: hypothetical protein VMJ32_12765 [Pirellulales bacterium]|nr:hypothetical protein [Pirellulales bacterium]